MLRPLIRVFAGESHVRRRRYLVFHTGNTGLCSCDARKPQTQSVGVDHVHADPRSRRDQHRISGGLRNRVYGSIGGLPERTTDNNDTLDIDCIDTRCFHIRVDASQGEKDARGIRQANGRRGTRSWRRLSTGFWCGDRRHFSAIGVIRAPRSEYADASAHSALAEESRLAGQSRQSSPVSPAPARHAHPWARVPFLR